MLNRLLLIGYRNDFSGMVLLFADIGYFTVDLGNNRNSLRRTCLKQFFNTRQTLGNIPTARCRTAGMEITHRQLGTRLADRLRGHNADRLSLFNRIAGCHIFTITLRTDTGRTFTSENIADIDLLYSRKTDLARQGLINIRIFRCQYLTTVRIGNDTRRITAFNTCLLYTSDAADEL